MTGSPESTHERSRSSPGTQTTHTLGVLLAASSAAASANSETGGLQAVLRVLGEGLGCERAALYLVRPARRLERVAAWGGNEDAARILDLDLDRCGQTQVVLSGEVITGDGGAQDASGAHRRGSVYVPLRLPGYTVGALELGRAADCSPPSAEELALLGVLANQLAVLAENQRLKEVNAARIEEFLALQRITRQMTSTLDIDELLQMVVEEALRLTAARGGTLFLLERERTQLRLMAWAGKAPVPGRETLPVGYGIPGWVARNGKPLRVSDRGPRREEIGYTTRKSQLAVPLLSEGSVMGVLAVEGGDEESFAETHEEILSIFAAQAAKAIEAAGFFRQIRQERDLRDKILGGTPNGVVALDGERRVVLINEAARRLLDVREAPEGNPVERYLSHPAFVEAMRKVLAGEAVLESLEIALGRGDEKRHLLVSIFALGEPSERKATLLLQDMTERRKLDERVQRMGRLASIGQLAAGIAHEIRNPLTGIAISLDILGEEALSPDGSSLLQDINQEIDRLEALVRGLLDFARPQPVESRPLTIAKALEWHRTFAEQCRKKGVAFKVELGRAARLRGDPERLKQLFLNLAINALEATPEGGSIRLWTEPVTNDSAAWVRVSIEDTGRGMHSDTAAQIFNPFFTTKNEGTGLGLSIAHSIVDQHGGRIDVQSRPGEGSCFTIDLPALVATEE